MSGSLHPPSRPSRSSPAPPAYWHISRRSKRIRSVSLWRPARRRRSCISGIGSAAPVILAPEVETRAGAEQLALDDASYRAQLSYLFERSSFYRRKLAEVGIASAAAAGGLAEIAE